MKPTTPPRPGFLAGYLSAIDDVQEVLAALYDDEDERDGLKTAHDLDLRLEGALAGLRERAPELAQERPMVQPPDRVGEGRPRRVVLSMAAPDDATPEALVFPADLSQSDVDRIVAALERGGPGALRRAGQVRPVSLDGVSFGRVDWADPGRSPESRDLGGVRDRQIREGSPAVAHRPPGNVTDWRSWLKWARMGWDVMVRDMGPPARGRARVVATVYQPGGAAALSAGFDPVPVASAVGAMTGPTPVPAVVQSALRASRDLGRAVLVQP